MTKYSPYLCDRDSADARPSDFLHHFDYSGLVSFLPSCHSGGRIIYPYLSATARGAAHASVRRFVLQLQLSFLRRSPAKLQSLQRRRRRRQNTSHSRSCLPKPPPSLPPSPHLSTSIHRSRMLTVSSTKALTHWSCTINHILATYAG